MTEAEQQAWFEYSKIAFAAYVGRNDLNSAEAANFAAQAADEMLVRARLRAMPTD